MLSTEGRFERNKCPFPEGVLLGILGVGVPPGSPNPEPTSDQKMSFFSHVFRPGLE